ncbi:T9SS type A sorting domain-containing protein, partial [bacterium]|nr:T9SS type A sorting domain-containing protein [bacterium]
TVTVAATGQTSKTIAVSQAGATGGDTYEPNGTVATAYGPLVSGTTYNSYIYSANEIDYYKLNVTMAGAITVTLGNLPGDYDLYLYSTDGTTQLGSSTASGTTSESINYSATAAGTYYVKVIGYNGVYSTTVAYALNATYPTGTPTPTLALSSSSWAPAAAGATSSAVNVTNSGSTSVIAYTVADDASWLTTSAASGSTPGSFTMTATANTGTTSRTATVTVTATTAGVAGSPKTISVTQAAPGTGGAEWTIMVFMNADNNLEEYGIQDFLEMAAASYSSGKINVIVQFDRSSSYATTYDNWTSCKRFKIANGMTPVASSQLSDIGEQSMGTGATLSTFANWAIDNYPANRYSLIMWDHGSGWYKGKGQPIMKDFSNDDSDGSVIGIANGEFATAMAAITSHLGRKLDHIGWDACLMGMWEVLDISRNYADVANVSEETEGADGWYYTTWLNTLNTTPTTSAIDMGKAIINTAIGMSTMSVVDLTQVPTLNTYVSTFADELMAAKAAGLSSSVSTALTNTQKFSTSYFSYHIDLSDFATKVKAAITTRPTLTTACNNVVSQVTNAVKLYKNTSSYANARGIAIFHNSSSSNYDTDYNSLPICASTHWDEYLKGQTSTSNVGATAGTLGETRFGSRGAAFELAPCVPNPARSSAMLSFQLVAPGQTALKVYNLNGQLVKTLVDAPLGQGWHDVSWDLTDDSGKQVTAGAYFYKLESGSARDMKRMIVVK